MRIHLYSCTPIIHAGICAQGVGLCISLCPPAEGPRTQVMLPLHLAATHTAAQLCQSSGTKHELGRDTPDQKPAHARAHSQVRKGQGHGSTLRRDDRPHRQQWHAGVLEHDHAYQWSRHVHPVYGINLIGLRAGLRYLVRCRDKGIKFIQACSSASGLRVGAFGRL